MEDPIDLERPHGNTLWEDPMGGPPQIWEDPMGGPCGTGGPHGRTIGQWRTPQIWEDPLWEDSVALEDTMGGPLHERTLWEDPVNLGGPCGRTLWHWRTPQIWKDPMGRPYGRTPQTGEAHMRKPYRRTLWEDHMALEAPPDLGGPNGRTMRH